MRYAFENKTEVPIRLLGQNISLSQYTRQVLIDKEQHRNIKHGFVSFISQYANTSKPISTEIETFLLYCPLISMQSIIRNIAIAIDELLQLFMVCLTILKNHKDSILDASDDLRQFESKEINTKIIFFQTNKGILQNKIQENVHLFVEDANIAKVIQSYI